MLVEWEVQLCFLKPQEHTVFDDVPPPNPNYMAWWIAKLRIAHPKLHIKIALVRERIEDTSLYLNAGANNFSRFMVFKDFGSEYAQDLKAECEKAGRKLLGEFNHVPELDINSEVDKTQLSNELKEQVKVKAQQYYERLQRVKKKFNSSN
jgi:biotin synthase-like enzyme